MQLLERLHTGLVMLTGWRRWLAAFAAGAATALAMAPFHLFVVCFATFPVLVWLLDGAVPPAGAGFIKRHRPAFAVGWWFGFGYFLAGTWWLANALLVEARDYAWFIPLAVMGLPAVLGLFYGLATALARAAWSDGLARLAMLAFGFGLVELLRDWVATGFPWNTIGYALTPVPVMMQSAAVIGVAGLNIIAVFLFALPAAFAGPARKPLIATALIVTILGVHTGYGVWRLASHQPAAGDAEPLSVRIVQPSIDQSTKVAGLNREEQLAVMLDLTSEPADDGVVPDLIVWPETAVPYLLTQSPEAVSAIAARLVPGQVLMTGAVRVEGDPAGGQPLRYYNSILMLDDEGVIIDAADKVHLVPFGEYLPFRPLFDALGLQAIAAADRGYVEAKSRTLLNLNGEFTLLPLICYEVIFSRYARNQAAEADYIVTVSNDGWFGNTPGPHQHLHHSRLRAVETGLPQIRAANTGVSASIDGFGRHTVQPLGYGVRGAMQFSAVQKLDSTPYVYGGLHYPWLLLLVFGLTGFIARIVTKSRFGPTS